jgi:hypothetical protein
MAGSNIFLFGQQDSNFKYQGYKETSESKDRRRATSQMRREIKRVMTDHMEMAVGVKMQIK